MKTKRVLSKPAVKYVTIVSFLERQFESEEMKIQEHFDSGADHVVVMLSEALKMNEELR